MKRPEPTLKARALRWLARREHSRAELAAKLAPHAHGEEEVAALLDEFEARGWLSDRRFIEQTLRLRAKKFGPLKIEQELRSRGLDEAAIDEALAQVRRDEFEAVREVWQRKFGKLPESAPDKARQVRFLQGRGFGLEAILRLLRDVGR